MSGYGPVGGVKGVVSAGRPFDGLADLYDRREQLVGDPLRPWLEEALPTSGESAVDLACGAGRHTEVIAQRYEHVLAIDLSPDMIELAQQRRPHENVEYRVADLRTVSGRFELVFCASALHDVEDLGAALNHVRLLVAPGGTVVIADVVGRSSPRPTWYIKLGSILHLPVELRRRPRQAGELLRLDFDPRWVRHLASDRCLSRRRFEKVYGQHFPGATFEPVCHLHICSWEAP